MAFVTDAFCNVQMNEAIECLTDFYELELQARALTLQTIERCESAYIQIL